MAENETFEDEESESSFDEDEMLFEDKVYDEDEAMYIQAYHTAYSDVRRDLRDRRKERGFVKRSKPTSSSRTSRPKGQGGFQRRRPPFRRDRGSSHNKAGAPGMVRGKPEDLAARARCFNCQELGHFAKGCPLKGGGKGSSKPEGGKKVNFIVSRGGGSLSQAVYMISTSSSISFSKEHLSIFAGIKVKGSQAIVDTAAEDAVIGTEALKVLQLELAQHGLQVLKVESERQVPCAGIGGEATAAGVVDVPTSIAGLHGVLRFSVLNDTAQFQTPPLLPISYLEAVGALLDFKNDRYATADGYSAAMVRLLSGHRVIDILNFDRPWALPSEFLGEDGDPFRLPEPSPSIEQKFGSSRVRDGQVDSSIQVDSSMLSPKASMATSQVFMATSIIQAASPASPRKSSAMSSRQAPVSESVEFMAQHFLSREDFTFEALEVLIDLLPRSSTKTTRAVMQSERDDSKRFVGGTYVHGGVAGVTQFSQLNPSFCKYMNKWASHHSAQSGWTSFQVSYGFKARVHKDSHNAGKNLITAVGSFTGGELWLAGDCGDDGRPRVKRVGSQWISGKAIDIKRKVFEFSPKSLHASLPRKGSRKSVTFYTIRDSFRLSAQDWQLLEDLQFPVQHMPKPTFFSSFVMTTRQRIRIGSTRHPEHHGR